MKYDNFLSFCRYKADAARKEFKMSAEDIKEIYTDKVYIDRFIEKRWQVCQRKLDEIAELMEVRGALPEDIEKITGVVRIPVIKVEERES